MASASPTLPRELDTPEEVARGRQIPWHLWMLVTAVLLVTFGGQADVSWHRSIGRDSFWTPPHMMVYACGVLAAVSCGWLIVACTLNLRPDLRANSINLLGLRAPSGVFLTAWGGLTMLASSPFDNWWHNAYGLDVQVASPPHIVLLAGTWAVCQGALLVTVAQMNRAHTTEAHTDSYKLLFLLVGSLSVIHLMSYAMTYTFDTRLHGWKPYLVISAGVPFALASLARARKARWTSTLVAVIYTGFMLLLVWGLPLIPATPRLGPVLQPVTCMIPPKFPILLLLPALGLDLLAQAAPRLSRWASAAVGGLTWVALLVAAEWPFASFLMSPAAANRFFGTIYHDFGTPSGSADVLRVFENPVHGAHLYAGLLAAAVVAAVGIRAGQIFGQWMSEVQR